MTSEGLDIPQIAVGVGFLEDTNHPTPIQTIPSPSSDSPHPPPSPLGHATSRTDNQGFLSPPTSILKSARNPLDAVGSPSTHTSDTSSLQRPPSPTLSAHSAGSIRFATSTILRDNNPDGLSSLKLVAPPPPHHRRKRSEATVSSVGSSSTEREYEDNQSFRLSPLRSAHSDATSTLPSPTHTHVDVLPDVASRPSSPASFFLRKTLHRVRRSSPSPSGETDTASETTRNDGHKGDDSDVKRKGPELARPPALDLKQEADLDVHPFAFKPLQLASLVDPKNLERIENMGGVDAILRGLGTQPNFGLSTRLGPRPSHPGSPDPASQDFSESHAADKDPPSPAASGVPQGLQSTASLSGAFGGRILTAFQSSEDVYRASIEDRRRIFGQNIFPQSPSKTLVQLLWLAFKDKVIILLSIAAVVSLLLGLFQDFGQPRPERESPVGWVESVTILVAILIVILVGSLNDWQKEKQFKVLNEEREDRVIKVIRDDEEQMIDIHSIVVGDVVLFEPGEIIPCDGIFLSGHNVRCDESGATGESDAIKKLSYRECIALRERRLAEFDPDTESAPCDGESTSGSRMNVNLSGLDLLGHTDCFVVSGSKVIEGIGSYLVVAVGPKRFNGRIMMALPRDSESTPLQLKLNNLVEVIVKIGSIAGVLLFVALCIRFIVQVATNNPIRNSSEKGIAFVQTLIISVTVVVVAVPEGLPLAVTLALAFATKRMTKENLLVRVLGSCETMASASVICADKTGTLTQNEMTVVAGSVGVHAKFVRKLDENRTRAGDEEKSGPNSRDFAIDMSNLNATLTPQLVELFNVSVSVNSTAFEDVDPESGAAVFIGSKTETALLKFAKDLGWVNYKETRDAANVIQMIPFSSERKAMGCVVRRPDGVYRLYIKGASEILTEQCTRHVVVHRDGANENTGGDGIETAPIGDLEEDNISRTITFYASQTLRTIALCYRDFGRWPPHDVQLLDNDEVEYDDLAIDLTLIGIVGIEDPLRAGVREAVANCIMAGVRVTMCTGDNVLTARSIAQQCGIYTTGGIIMEGSHFRSLSQDIMKAIAPRLQVLARSSAEDKRLLVETLKECNDIVGVTGDGTDDGPALKTANVGFSMGIAGTEIAKEASDIILMDDNFSSIVKAIIWGRCVNDSVRKFLQFQITTIITAVVITFATAIASYEKEGTLSTVQLLWINLIMDTFAALALATDPASPILLNRKPHKKTDPLFTVDMLKQILGQSAYQIVVILIFHFLGSRILGFQHSDDSTVQKHNDAVVHTLVFNAFVFAQITNSFNCRRLDTKLNVFEGMLKNWYFMAVTFIEIAVQVMTTCFVGGSAFQVTRMGGKEWGISLALGCISLPLGALIRLTPSEPCRRIFERLRLLPKPDALPTMFPNVEPGFAFAEGQMRDNLSTFAKLRGGRMRGSSFVRKSRSVKPDLEGPRLVSGLLANVPPLVVSQVVAPDLHHQNEASLSDPAGLDPSTSSAALRENKFEIHPDTARDDPVFRALGAASRPLTPRYDRYQFY